LLPAGSRYCPHMVARIVLFGASGHTGGRTAEALVTRGVRPVLAGRDPGRLEPLAVRLGGAAGPLETVTADVTDAASVRGLVGRGDVLVTTVGPFLRLGEPAVAAASDAGAVYLDSTGEPPFLRRVFAEFGPAPSGPVPRCCPPSATTTSPARWPVRSPWPRRGSGRTASTSATAWMACTARASPAALWSHCSGCCWSRGSPGTAAGW
jgi:NAD(P)-dependent dehydrogenase (short-subunit alcohol dehydrogenase family)